MESHNILEYGEFISSVRQNRDSKFGFLLGAGPHCLQAYNLPQIASGIGKEKYTADIMKATV